MKKMKNKFVISVLILIFLVIVFQIFFVSNNRIDTNSYVTLVEWKASLNKNFLKKDVRELIGVWDSIRTIGKKSIAVIKWWDGSITRLWPNTLVLVDENDVSENLSKIQIWFKLLNWKTWSNVISFIGEDSYFKESFNDLEAWVRWTVFNVDLDKDYLNVLSHELSLKTKDWKLIKILEDEALSLSNFSLIDLNNFISKLKDDAWENLNKWLDKSLVENLKSSLWDNLGKNNLLLSVLEIFFPKYKVLYELDNGKDFGKIEKLISWLSDENKGFLYEEVTAKYQKLNFVDYSDENLYKSKLFYKKVLLLLASPINKENLIKYSVFDFKDILKSWDTKNLQETISLLSENKDFLKNLDSDFLNTINLELIPNDLKEIFKDNFEGLKWIFGDNFSDFDDLDSLEEKAKEKIGETLDKFFE